MNRARIIITNLLWYLVAIVALSGLYPVARSYLNTNAEYIPNNAETLLYGVAPLAIIILLAVIYKKAQAGVK